MHEIQEWIGRDSSNFRREYLTERNEHDWQLIILRKMPEFRASRNTIRGTYADDDRLISRWNEVLPALYRPLHGE